jgi:phosphoglycolate phosphatase-like HAD superfamily hydrolase
MTQNRKIVIFDLDGTLANIDARRALCIKPDGKMNFDKFFDPVNISLDLPIPQVIAMFHAMQKAGHRVLIFSGRGSITRNATIGWLEANDIQPDMLFMRPEGDYTPDDELKKMWLIEKMGVDPADVLCVFDDRDKVVAMWRSLGIQCFQCCPGDF